MRFRNNAAAVIIILVLSAALNLSGTGMARSATRIGYVSSESRSSWSASYALLNGTMQRTVRPSRARAQVHIETVTAGGMISIEMRDTKGNIVLDEENIGTASFEIEIPGEVVVTITADHHRGSFKIAG